MRRGERRHAGGLLYRWGPVLLVLVLLAGAAAAYRFDLGERWLGIEQPDPVDNPAAVPPPPGLDLPEPSPPAEVAAALEPGPLDPARVRRALQPVLADRKLGRHVVAQVEPVPEGPAAFRLGDPTGDLVIPASTLKLLTATAALEVLGPATTFRTAVVAGQRPDRIVLVGGGDPYLASKPVRPVDADATYPVRADVVTLAERTAEALLAEGTRRVRLDYDTSLFRGPAVSPAWEPGYVPDQVVSPITALWVDRGADPVGWGRVDDPALVAAETFAAALGEAGVRVVGVPRSKTAPEGAAELAAVESAPVDAIVRHLLDVSDNEAAEVLAHHVGAVGAGDASFAGGAAATRQVLTELGVDLAGARIRDGSGLSRGNRLTATSLLDVLRLAADETRPELRPVLEGLPVAGFTGSLTTRFADGKPQGPGRVRAKTGTLSGVHALAGVVDSVDGAVMLVVLVADRVRLENTLDARATLDQAAAALAACRCGAAA